MEDLSYPDNGRPWKAWAWPAVYVAAFIAMILFGTDARPGNERDLWITMAVQALAITGIVAVIKTWERGFTLGNAGRVVGFLVLVGVLAVATVLALLERHGWG